MPLVLGWLLLAGPVWGAVGAVAVPRRYRSKGADPRLAGAAGALVGLAAGLPALLPLWLRVPPLRRWWALAVPSLLLGAELLAAFAVTQPGNACVRGPGYLATQLGTGLLVGAVLATAAVGLTLVYSVLGVVSFAYGQFVMAGGVTAFLLLTQVWPVNPLLVVPVVALAGFGLGVLVDSTLLTPLHRGRVRRPDEYAVLVTFGLGVFMQYALLGVLGPTSGLRAPRYTDRPLFGLSAGRLAGLDTNLLVAGAVGAGGRVPDAGGAPRRGAGRTAGRPGDPPRGSGRRPRVRARPRPQPPRRPRRRVHRPPRRPVGLTIVRPLRSSGRGGRSGRPG